MEDTGLPITKIAEQFGEETASAVDAISRRKDESWDDYLLRVKKNETARHVKISDLIDNSNLARLPAIVRRGAAVEVQQRLKIIDDGLTCIWLRIC